MSMLYACASRSRHRVSNACSFYLDNLGWNPTLFALLSSNLLNRCYCGAVTPLLLRLKGLDQIILHTQSCCRDNSKR